MTDEIKIEFGADFKRWLTAKIILTCLVLSVIGGYLYHRVTAAALEEAEKEHIREQGIEGVPILFGVTQGWFEKKDVDPGLKLTPVMMKGLDLTTAAVAPAQKRSLPPQIGTLNYDNETMFLIKCRFTGELTSVLKVKDKMIDKDGYEKIIERPLKFGDKVKQGDVLAVFWSIALGTAKAAFVDAISAVRLSEDALDRQQELYDKGALPLGTLMQAQRQLQGDNNNLKTAERSLRMWKMTDDEISNLRQEANEIIDSLVLNPRKGTIKNIDAAKSTLTINAVGKDLEYVWSAATKVTDAHGKPIDSVITEKTFPPGMSVNFKAEEKNGKQVLASIKKNDVLDEVNRWARTEVNVPWFDQAQSDRELTVVEKNTNIGDIVDNANYGTWLFKVADLGKLQIWVHPAEEYLPLIREGLKRNGGLEWEIRMQSDPNAPPLILPVDMICPSLEPNQHNPMVIGYLPNKDHKFLVGQFVTATLQMPPEENSVEIPTAAINEYNAQSFIFVKVKDKPGEFVQRRVAIVRRYADFSVIRSKLRPQDVVFSAAEVKAGRYPLKTMEPGEQVVTHGVVEMTTALESLLSKEDIKLQRSK
jgi:multidrug efflux pump subunit AcrA (membrane-fusion protein)